MPDDALRARIEEIRSEPERLDPAPRINQATAIDQRRTSGLYRCLLCGDPAHVVYIMETKAGPRWLDLCPPHGIDVHNLADDWKMSHDR